MADQVVFYVTKWCLTRGIMKMYGEIAQGKYFSAVAKNFRVFVSIGKDAFSAQAEAEANVAKRLTAKATSLEKQLAKIRTVRARDAALKIDDRTAPLSEKQSEID